MNFIESKPFVRQALHARLDVQKATRDLYQTLQTRDSRLFYILSGEGKMKIGDQSYLLQSDMILLFKAGTPYEWRVTNADYYAINFDYSNDFSHIRQSFHPYLARVFMPEMVFDCGKIEDCSALEQPLVLYKTIGMKQAIRNIVAESAMKDEWSGPILSAMLSQIILELIRMEQKASGITDSRQNVKQVIGYINEHFSEQLTNAAIAAAFGYNPNYLGRIFRQHTGSTLHEFLTDLRLKAAMELLTDPQMSINHICRQVGLPDLYHFSKLFKQKTGLAPTQYRKQQISP